MNESNRPNPIEPISNQEALILLQEQNKNYRELLKQKDDELRASRIQGAKNARMVDEYRDIIQLIKDVRNDVLHRD